MSLRYVNDKNFEKEVSGFDGPKMVAFYAAWCPHCHHMVSLFEELARRYEGKANLFVVDVEQSPKAVARYSVRGVPTLLFFRDAEHYTQHVGEENFDFLQKQMNKIC